MNSLCNAALYTGVSSSSNAPNNNATQISALSEEDLFEKDLTDWVERIGLYLNDEGEPSKDLRKRVINRIKTTKMLETTQDLLLAWFYLPSLPKAVYAITHIAKLVLYSNRLTILPGEIGLLKNLKILDLYNNLLEELPPTIGNLTNLSTLHLRKNLLKTLPHEIGRLRKLRVLDLQQNPLKTLPSEMSQLTDLEDFALPGDVNALFDRDNLANLLRDGVIVDRRPPHPTGKTVTDVVIFIKNTKDFVDVEKLFGDIKNADTRS